MKNDISLEKRLLVNELHAPARRNFKRRFVVVKEYDDLWQADVVEMRSYSRFNSGYKYILSVINVLVLEYNNRKHRTIGMRPIDVTPAIAKRLLSTVYSRIKIAAPAKFKVADPVRVSKFKTIFEKSQISLRRGLYKHELLRTAQPDVYLVEKVLRRKDDEVFVK
ncbi:uncharacterized protein [Linepithema humile]|uniref:uncharacterized protein n=1 Tax=Linepithema humile TaxID=83485 RepID=UPI00351E35FA